MLEQQVRRMLADPRAQALVDNFAGQWLYLRNLKSHVPDTEEFPDFDDNLRQAFRRETELFFDSIMREDRSVLDLLTADYTFVNERLARHYGIPNVYGSQFRRVTLADATAAGCSGQGSILTVTSYPNRTSPVLRGKWILENILGTPPPPPPPNVPALPDNAEDRKGAHGAGADGEAPEQSRLCELPRVMDPLGFALENFDARRAVAHEGSGRCGRCRRSARGRHRCRRPGQAAPGAGETPGSVRRHDDREAADLRAGPWARALRHAGRPRDCARVAPRSNYRFSSIVLGIVKSTPFQMKKAQNRELASRRSRIGECESFELRPRHK